MSTARFIPAARFRLLTPIYDQLCSAVGLGSRLREFEVDHLPLDVRGTVLEVGCGSARLLSLVGQRHPSAHLVGLDVDQQILELARVRTEASQRASWILSRAESLPIRDGSCALVLSSLMLHHLPTDAKRAALREWRRVLAPAGELLLFDLGVPRSLPAKLLLWPLRFRILEHQADNLRGLVPGMLRDAGFVAEEIGVYRSAIVGYRAVRQHE